MFNFDRYLYPHKLLCHQFWTIEQKLKFGELDHLKKLELHHPLISQLLQHADTHLGEDESKTKNELIDFVQHMSTKAFAVDDLVHLNGIFRRKEFGLETFSAEHLVIISFHVLIWL